MNSLKDRKGFFLLEITMGMGLLLLVLFLVLPLWQLFAHFTVVAALDRACQLLASELTTLQINTLYNGQGEQLPYLLLEQDGSGYMIFDSQRRIRSVSFAACGLKDIAVTCSATKKLGFSNNGGPQKAVTLKVNNTKTGEKKFVEVQPVTGRVVITDESS